MKYHGLILGLFILLQSCLHIEQPHSMLAPGLWRAVLKVEQNFPQAVRTDESGGDPSLIRVDEISQGELPFNFEVIYDSEDEFHIEIINGTERILVDNIIFGLDRSTAKDTITIDFPVYDSYIKGIHHEKVIRGEWVVRSKSNYSIPFVARHGEGHRFTNLKKKPKEDLSGRWAVTFGIDKENPYPAIGDFEQDGNNITGTFMTETGDYRYLDGTVQDNKFYLSCFDGAHAFLFEAKIGDDGKLIGSFKSGNHYSTLWEAQRNPEVTLQDPYDLTYMLDPSETFAFSFLSSDGNQVSLTDPVYEGKAKILQIFGTWCPNCKDETTFLVDHFKNQPTENLAIIGLGFERYADTSQVLNILNRYKEELEIPYELLYAGPAAKKDALKSLPMLNEIISYPTMIFLDKHNRVIKIHTGFSGPATSDFNAFVTEFEKTVVEIAGS